MKTRKKEIKEIVKEKYSKIAEQSQKANCGCSCVDHDIDYTIFSESYQKLEGYNPDADLNLGCGIPTEYAGIRPGDTVLDLGSGAGNDCFVARALAGETGRVIGLDFSDAMVAKARKNVERLGYTNVEFLSGDIEEMPVPAETADVVISNCVLNLVPDKQKAFSGIYRVLKPGGHFCISDVVLSGALPEGLKNDAVMYAGCVAGAIQQEKYLDIIRGSGFKNIGIKKSKEIILPDGLLKNYLSENEIREFRESQTGIFSITVVAEK